MPKQKQKKRSAFRPLVSTLIAAVLLFGLGMAVIYGYSLFGTLQHKDRDDFKTLSSVAEVGEGEYVSGGTKSGAKTGFGSGDILSDKDVQNVLLIGCDANNNGYGRSDAMILFSIDRREGKLKMTSFLRDLYVKIPGQQDNRLNYAFAAGGPGLLTQTIEQNFRIKIDHYVKVDFTSFRKVVNLLGGVDIKLTDAEARHLMKEYHYTGLKAGKNTLDGGQALNYARIRKLDSDFGRTSRQRKVLDAILTKFKSAGVQKLVQIANEVLPLTQTDFSTGDVISLAMDSGKLLSYPTAQLYIPQNGAYKDETIRHMMVLVPDVEKNKQALWKFIYEK